MQKFTNFLCKHFDKVLHFVCCLLAFVVFAKVGMWVFCHAVVAMCVAAFVTMLVGVLKEVCDRHAYGDFNRGDLVADALGVLAGILLIVYLVIL